MVNKTVFVVCLGGLGNRLYSLIGGLYWAQKYNCSFNIVWSPSDECDVGYTDLFSTHTDSVISLSRLKHILFKSTDLTVAGFLQQKKALQNDIFLRCIKDRNILNNIRDPDHLQSFNGSLIYNNIGLPLYIGEHTAVGLLNCFKINNDIVERVTTFIKQNNITENDTGFIVRKTDAGSIVNTEKIFNYIKDNTSTRFYITSDSKEVEIKFNKNKNVLCYPKLHYVVFNKNKEILYRSKQSVIEAFISLLIASKTHIIDITSNKSSFTKIALLYKNIKF
jgi:hypothetical protein